MGTEKPLSISKAARLTGLHPKAIRYYEDLGVIKTVRSASGYRLFQGSDLTRLRLIGQLRRLGFTASEMKQVLPLLLDQPRKPTRNHRLEKLLAKRLADVGDELECLSSVYRGLKRKMLQLRRPEKASQASCCEPFCGPDTCGPAFIPVTELWGQQPKLKIQGR